MGLLVDRVDRGATRVVQEAEEHHTDTRHERPATTLQDSEGLCIAALHQHASIASSTADDQRRQHQHCGYDDLICGDSQQVSQQDHAIEPHEVARRVE